MIHHVRAIAFLLLRLRNGAKYNFQEILRVKRPETNATKCDAVFGADQRETSVFLVED